LKVYYEFGNAFSGIIRGREDMDNILIVDDIDVNRMILNEILNTDYNVFEAEDGFRALEMLDSMTEMPKAVLLDIMMPGMDGFGVLEKMKGNPEMVKIPVLFITAADADVNESRCLKAGGSDFIPKPFNPDVVKARVDNFVQLKNYRDSLEEMLEKKTKELIATNESTIETLATIVEHRSLESGAHIQRVSELTKIIAKAVINSNVFQGQIDRSHLNSVAKASKLHDIGKIGIPDRILLKPGPLNDEEFEVMKGHSFIGSKIIEQISKNIFIDEANYLTYCGQICLSHHERWDGRGYPNKLKGEEIPLSARLLSVIDVYDALVNKRCYKPSLSHEETIAIILQGKGTQFDPRIVEIFVENAEKIRLIEEELGDRE